jgi:hypothetical protein
VVNIEGEAATINLKTGDVIKMQWEQNLERDMLRRATGMIEYFQNCDEVGIRADFPFC